MRWYLLLHPANCKADAEKVRNVGSLTTSKGKCLPILQSFKHENLQTK